MFFDKLKPIVSSLKFEAYTVVFADVIFLC